jgi:energy-coupling factor transport system permease protein
VTAPPIERPLPRLARHTAVVERAPALHAVTAFVWAIAAAASVQLAPNPVYVALIIVISALVVEALAGASPFRRAFPALIALGVVFSVVRIVLAALTTHGVGHVLFALPAWTLPNALGGFTVGGSIELPVILQTAAEGFALVGVMAAFGAFNAIVSHYELTQSFPRAFFELGLIVTIALAFVPSTISAMRSVREADRARTGGVVKRRGRLLRQVLPVLEIGMERAVALSESMDARGFAAAPPGPGTIAAGWATLAGLLALGGAFIALIGGARGTALACGAAGTLALALATRYASRSTRRTRYRARPVQRLDAMVMAAAVAAPIALGGLRWLDDSSLTWVANPLHWPSVHVLPAIAILLLAAPLAAIDRAP